VQVCVQINNKSRFCWKVLAVYRKEWGSISGQKYELESRNQLIRKDFQNGKTVNEISKEYYLTKSSIYRILKDCN